MANFVFTYSAPATGTVEIETNEPGALVAPTQIWLKAINHSGLAPFEETGPETGNVYDGAQHEYYHEWTINGEPLSDWSKPDNLLSAHNNPNKMFGREVAFCLPTPGHYVIDLVVTDRLGVRALASTQTLIVFDPESYFPPADRIYVDPDGIHAGVPAASEKVDTIEEARVAMQSRTANPTWLLLRRGVEHSMDGVDFGNAYNEFHGVLIASQFNDVRMISGYGPSSERPSVTLTTLAERASTNALFVVQHPLNGDWRTINGIEFRGYRDGGTEHGYGNQYGATSAHQWGKEGYFTVHDCISEGLGYGFVVGGATGGLAHRQVISDCAANNILNMGVYGGKAGVRVSVQGTRLAHNVNAPNYGGGEGIRNFGGGLRIPKAAYIHIAGCDVFSRCGWDNNAQPCLRLFTDPDAGQEGGIVERCSLEGGYEILQMTNSAGLSMYPFNMVVERNLLVASASTTTMIAATRSGTTIRDNLLIWPNTPTKVTPGLSGLIGFSRTGSSEDEMPGLYSNPISIYGNTTLNQMSAANDTGAGFLPVKFTGDENGDYFTNVINENNIEHRPDGSTVVDTYAPLDLSTPISGMTPRYAGFRYSFEMYNLTLGADYGPGASVSIPYSLIGDGLNLGTPSTGPTDQAYWLANGGTLHQFLLIDGTIGYRNYYADQGHVTVTFGASEITVTNNTTETWSSGATFYIWLDRISVAPAMDTSYANPASLPLPRPEAGSPAAGTATAGRVSPRDFLLADRGASPSKGALEPA